MNPIQDRRTPHAELADQFSPEYLAMLVVCGGTVRDSDWSVLPAAVAARRFFDPSRRALAAERAPALPRS